MSQGKGWPGLRLRPRALEPRVVFDAAAAAAEPPPDAAVALPGADASPATADAGRVVALAADTRMPAGTDSVGDDRDTSATDAPGKVLVVVDARVDPSALRVPDDGREVTVLVVRADERDPFARVQAALDAAGGGVTALHIVSHGAEGSFELGTQVVDAAALAQAAGERVAAWQPRLAAGADILLYGCSTGAGDAGGLLLQRLAQLTGADVAASVDATGGTLSGGDMELERSTGAIQATALQAVDAQGMGLLAFTDLASDAGWKALLVGANFDPNNDTQSNTSDVDLLGNASNPLLYTKYDEGSTAAESDDTIAFRFRIDGKTSTSWTSIVFVGIDANRDGKLDIFLAAEGNNRQQVAIYTAGGDLNISPSTTSISGGAVWSQSFATSGSGLNYNLKQTGGDLDGNGIRDQFVSFQLPWQQIKTVLAGLSTPIAVNTSSAMNFIVLSAQQTNSLNGDFGGIDDSTANANLTYSQLGLTFTRVLTASNLAPVIGTGATSAAYTVSENTTSVATLQGSDPENAALAWSITGGADASKFSIDPSTGALRFVSAPDFETPTDTGTNNVYDLQVTLTDAGSPTPASTVQNITVTVTDVAEPPALANDAGSAREAGGGTAATQATGNVLTNDTGATLVTVAGRQGGGTSAITAAGVTLTGQYGSLLLKADGSYTYTVNDANASVNALRLSTDTLVDNFTYTARNAAGVTATATLAITIAGRDDAPTAANDALAVTEDTASGTGNVVTGVPGTDGDPDAGDVLTVTAVSRGATAGTVGSALAGQYGTLTLGANGGYVYAVDRANPAVNGLSASQSLTDTFSYTITDTGGLTATATLTVTISGVNDAPSITGGGVSPLARSIAENTRDVSTFAGTDPEGDALAWSIVPGDDGAKFGIDGTGKLFFLVPPDFETPTDGDADNVYRVTIRASDGRGGTVTQVVDVNVTDVVEPVNQAPVAVADTLAVSEDASSATGDVIAGASGGAGADTDADTGDVLTVVSVQTAGGTVGSIGAPLAGMYGSLTLNANGTYSYAVDRTNPAVDGLSASQSLTDTFGYAISDGNGGTATATLTVTIGGVNDAPVIGGSGPTLVTVPENITGTVTTPTAVDPEGDPLTWSITGGADAARFAIDPTTGALSFVGGPDFELPVDAGTDNVYEVDVAVDDGQGNVVVRQVHVTVTNLNEGPTAANDALAVTEDTASGTGNVVTGVPGTDGDPDAGDVLTVTAVSRGATAGTVGSALAGQYGTLTLGANGGYVYAVDRANPAVDALRLSTDTLTETFTYTVTDTGGLTSTATLTVTITGVDDAPVIGGSGPTTVSVPENGTGVTTLTATDPEGDPTGWSITGGPDASRFAIDPATGVLTFVTGPDFELPDDADTDNVYEVDVTVDDGNGHASVRRVQVTVTDANEAPVAVADALSVGEDAASGSGNVITGSPGTDTDPDAGDTMTVTGVSRGGTTGTVGAALVGTHGTLTLDANGGYTYVPDAGSATVQALSSGQTVTDSFSYTITDTGGLTSTATLTITITGVNDAPSITGGTGTGGAAVDFSVPERTTQPVTSFAVTDPDGGTPAWSITGGPDAARFAIDPATGALTFVAPPDFEAPTDQGTDNVYELVVQVTDGQGGVTTQAVRVTVTDGNEAPSALADAGNAAEDGPAATGNVLTGTGGIDTDPDAGDVLTVTGVTDWQGLPGTVGTALAGRHGTLTLRADGTWTYAVNDADPAVGALRGPTDTLTDIFTYEIRDAGGLADTATLTVTIAGANDAPAITGAVGGGVVAGGGGIGGPLDRSIPEDTRAVTTLTGTDPDGDPLSWTVTGGPDAVLFEIDPVTGALRFMLPPDHERPTDAGTDNVYEVTVTATDGRGGSVTQVVRVTVTDVGEAPVAPAPVVPAPVAVVVPPVPVPPASPIPAPAPAPLPPESRVAEPSLQPARAEPAPVARPAPVLLAVAPPETGADPLSPPAFAGVPVAAPERTLEPAPAQRGFAEGELYTSGTGYRAVVVPMDQPALVVFKGMADQYIENGAQGRFSVPADAFVHSRPDQQVTLAAKLADGRPLPAWLIFDSRTGAFAGEPPKGFTGELRVQVLARDTQGREAATLFRLHVGKARDTARDAARGTLGFSDRLRGATLLAKR